MNSELFLYDRDQGLFKQILNKSKTIEGRYHVAPNYGHELNTNNLDQYINDPASGLTDVKQKYPCCVCIAPKSRIIRINGAKWEEFYFHLFFLCTTYYTGDNQIKSLNEDTNTSAHHVWYDWSDMKEVAVNFMEAFKNLLKPVRMHANVDFDNAVIARLSKFLSNRVSGVGVSFVAHLYVGECVLTDYEADDLAGIVLPDFDIHPLHKQ